MNNKHKLVILYILSGVVLLQPILLKADRKHVNVIRLEGVINPVSADYIITEIERAVDDSAEALIIEMDTPGGLMESMRQIVKAFLDSRVPVVVFVSPSGSRAASAGVFITMAAHVAAMDNSTNIGAAHPVAIGGAAPDSGNPMMEKLTNDAVAQIRSVAEKKGRNADWAEEAVRMSVSITETEALELNVVDYVCPDLDSLLRSIDGDTVLMEIGEAVISTAGAEVRWSKMNLRYDFLFKISNPNIAYIFMILGFYGIFFELSNPGSVIPGVVGGIFLILAFFSFQTLPISWAGLALILFALILFALEVKVTSYGVLTIGGIISMILGSIMLIDTPVPALKISLSVIIPAVLLTAVFFTFAMYMYFRIQKKRPATGREGIIGEVGIARSDIHKHGEVSVHGEIWKATSSKPISSGVEVEVTEVKGLKLKVRKK